MENKNLKNKKAIQDELNSISPMLAKMEKKNPFKVPSNYFESLSEEIFEKIKKETPANYSEAKPSWFDQVLNSIALRFQPKLIAVMASALVLLGIAFSLMNKNTEDLNSIVKIENDLSTEEAQIYLAEHLEDFEEDLFYQLDFENNNLGFLSIENIEEDDLDEYLDEILDEMDESALEELL